MTLTTSFMLRAPLERVWRALLDVPGIVHCLPGVQLTSVLPARTYAGRVELQIGPLHRSYAGRVQIDEVDEDRHSVRMTARGENGGGGQATVRARLMAQGEVTTVVMEADVRPRGILARLGPGGMVDMVVKRMTERFATCLQHQLNAPA